MFSDASVYSSWLVLDHYVVRSSMILTRACSRRSRKEGIRGQISFQGTSSRTNFLQVVPAPNIYTTSKTTPPPGTTPSVHESVWDIAYSKPNLALLVFVPTVCCVYYRNSIIKKVECIDTFVSEKSIWCPIFQGSLIKTSQ